MILHESDGFVQTIVRRAINCEMIVYANIRYKVQLFTNDVF